MMQRVVEWSLRELGEEHPRTLTYRANLGIVLRGVDRRGEAAEQYRAAHRAQLKVLGPDHNGTPLTQQNLAGTLLEIGKGRGGDHPARRRAITAGRDSRRSRSTHAGRQPHSGALLSRGGASCRSGGDLPRDPSHRRAGTASYASVSPAFPRGTRKIARRTGPHRGRRSVASRGLAQGLNCEVRVAGRSPRGANRVSA